MDRPGVVCVGAGARAMAAHYPCLRRLAAEQAIEIVGICELDPTRLQLGGDFLGLPAAMRFDSLATILAATRPDLAYVIMGPRAVLGVAQACFASGAHVVLEKPPGASLAEVDALLAAARSADRRGSVLFQRRLASVVVEALRRIHERGPLTTCLLEFHKCMVGTVTPPWGVSTLWEDVVHVVDLARHLAGGRAVSVHAHRDAHGTAWPNVYSALVRFDTGASAFITGNRSSGGRLLRVEAHGLGLGAYMDEFPTALRLLADNGASDTTTAAAALANSADVADWDGLMATHREILTSLREGRPALTDLTDAAETMRLVDWIERAGAAGGSAAPPGE